MAMMIQISEDKIDELADGMNEMLHAGGKLMSCIENMRGNDEVRSKYGRRRMYGRRDEDDWEDERERDYMGRHGGRDYNGRYM